MVHRQTLTHWASAPALPFWAGLLAARCLVLSSAQSRRSRVRDFFPPRAPRPAACPRGIQRVRLLFLGSSAIRFKLVSAVAWDQPRARTRGDIAAAGLRSNPMQVLKLSSQRSLIAADTCGKFEV